MENTNNVNVAALKAAVSEKANQLKVVFLAKKVKKDKWDSQFFLDTADLFENYSEKVSDFCIKYDIDEKFIKKAEKQGEKAIASLLEE